MKTDKIQTIATNKIKLYVNQLDKVRLGEKSRVIIYVI